MNLQIHNPPWLITRTHYHDNDDHLCMGCGFDNLLAYTHFARGFEYGRNDHLKTRINGLI